MHPRSAFLPALLCAVQAMSTGCITASEEPNVAPNAADNDATALEEGGIVADTGGLVATNLVVEPNNAVVYTDTGKSPVKGGSVALKVLEDGVDVTATSTFTLVDASVGSFAGNTFTSTADLGKDSSGANILGKTTVVEVLAASGRRTEAKITVVELRQTKDPVTSAKDFFFTVPYAAAPSPAEDILEFTTNIQQVDVAFVTDTTGSMSGAIANIEANLSDVIIPALKKVIPSVAIGVVDHRDIPASSPETTGYGYPGDWVAKVRAPITVQNDAASLALVQKAVSGYAAGGGGPTPAEAQIPAMFFTLTGKGFSWPATNFGTKFPAGKLESVTPKPGTFGAVGFREGAVPVIVLTTDQAWHNGLSTTPFNFYTTVPEAPKLAALEAAFKKVNAKFVSVVVSTFEWSGEGNPFTDPKWLSDKTSSNILPAAFDGPGKPSSCGAGECCTGTNGEGRAPDGPGGRCRLNFLAGPSGASTSTSIVNGIRAIAAGTVYDILPELANDPANPGSVDATKFIDRLEAFADPKVGCAGTPRKSTPSKTYMDMISGIVAGKQTACFRVIPKRNDVVPAKSTAQFFNALVKMKGIAPGEEVTASTARVDLGDTRTILLLVPPTPPVPR